MIEINPTRFQLPPREHQLRGLKTLITHPHYGLFWEMRLQKTKTCIDTAITLFDADEIDIVVIVAPSQVVGTWLDPEFGELQIHAPGYGRGQYNARSEDFVCDKISEGFWGKPAKLFLVMSLEFCRQEAKHKREYPKIKKLLAALKGYRYWLIMDEGSSCGEHRSNTWRALRELRTYCTRFTMLDGTPTGEGISVDGATVGSLEQYAKFKLIMGKLFSYKTFSEFKDTHCIYKTVGGFPKLVGWRDQNLIDAATKDHCEYLEQKDLPYMNFPEKVPGVISIAMSEKTWETYTTMRDEFFAQLDSGECEVQHAPVLALRLAQICAGFLGGVMDDDAAPGDDTKTVELGQESLKGLMTWLKARLHERPDFKVVIWCRWRPEIERLVAAIQMMGLPYGLCYGGGKENLEALNRRANTKGPFIMIAQPQAARFGKDFSLADTAVYLSQDYSRKTRSQSEDRIQAENVRNTSFLLDVLITGPIGQRTAIHDIVGALRRKEAVARRTAAEWKKALV